MPLGNVVTVEDEIVTYDAFVMTKQKKKVRRTRRQRKFSNDDEGLWLNFPAFMCVCVWII